MALENWPKPKQQPISQEQGSAEKIIDNIVTAKGSVYKYLLDGTTQRYKKAENKEHEPQNAIVFVPDYETLKKISASSDFVEQIGENETQFEQILLASVQNNNSMVYIVNPKGEKLDSNDAIRQNPDPTFLTIGHGSKIEFWLPVSKIPKIGYYTFNTKKYKDEKTGGWKRLRHLGNKVTEINYKK